MGGAGAAATGCGTAAATGAGGGAASGIGMGFKLLSRICRKRSLPKEKCKSCIQIMSISKHCYTKKNLAAPQHRFQSVSLNMNVIYMVKNIFHES